MECPRLIWIMVTYNAVDSVLSELTTLLSEGDTIIDAGNSPYKETLRRSKELKKSGVNFMDVGVSGGPDGAGNGASRWIGGEKSDF